MAPGGARTAGSALAFQKTNETTYTILNFVSSVKPRKNPGLFCRYVMMR
jgi:hypothetical protein